MNIWVVIVALTALVIVGITTTVFAINRKNRPIQLSALHLVLTAVGFGVFTAYMSSTNQPIFSFPQLSYLSFAVAGVTAVVMVVKHKLLEKKSPAWVPIMYACVLFLGYASLWGTYFRFY